MRPIIRIAMRRIRRNLGKSVFFMISILFSVLIISFFAYFEMQTAQIGTTAYDTFPELLTSLRQCMNTTLILLILMTFSMVTIHGRIRGEENRQTLAVLASIGASARQKRALVLLELFVLYFPPTVLGVIGGCLPGILLGRQILGESDGDPLDFVQIVGLAILLIVAVTLLVLLGNHFSGLLLRKTPIVQTIKKHNPKVSDQNHSYRQSQTFQSQSILKKLAQKSIEFYGKTYNSIAVFFSLSALYPVLAVLVFYYLGSAKVSVDINTASDVGGVIDSILLLLLGSFLFLTFSGALQAIILTRMQILKRKQSALIYRSVGMLDSGIRRMIRYELQSVLIKVFVYLIFEIVFANACYAMLVG